MDDITIEPPDGGPPIDIESGTKVESFFDLDIYELSYSYSFFQDDRLDLAAGLGFDAFRFALESDGRDYPEVDLDGKVTFDYTGLQLYVRAFFQD